MKTRIFTTVFMINLTFNITFAQQQIWRRALSDSKFTGRTATVVPPMPSLGHEQRFPQQGTPLRFGNVAKRMDSNSLIPFTRRSSDTDILVKVYGEANANKTDEELLDVDTHTQVLHVTPSLSKHFIENTHNFLPKNMKPPVQKEMKIAKVDQQTGSLPMKLDADITNSRKQGFATSTEDTPMKITEDNSKSGESSYGTAEDGPTIEGTTISSEDSTMLQEDNETSSISGSTEGYSTETTSLGDQEVTPVTIEAFGTKTDDLSTTAEQIINDRTNEGGMASVTESFIYSSTDNPKTESANSLTGPEDFGYGVGAEGSTEPSDTVGTSSGLLSSSSIPSQSESEMDQTPTGIKSTVYGVSFSTVSDDVHSTTERAVSTSETSTSEAAHRSSKEEQIVQDTSTEAITQENAYSGSDDIHRAKTVTEQLSTSANPSTLEINESTTSTNQLATEENEYESFGTTETPESTAFSSTSEHDVSNSESLQNTGTTIKMESQELRTGLPGLNRELTKHLVKSIEEATNETMEPKLTEGSMNKSEEIGSSISNTGVNKETEQPEVTETVSAEGLAGYSGGDVNEQTTQYTTVSSKRTMELQNLTEHASSFPKSQKSDKTLSKPSKEIAKKPTIINKGKVGKVLPGLAATDVHKEITHVMETNEKKSLGEETSTPESSTEGSTLSEITGDSKNTIPGRTPTPSEATTASDEGSSGYGSETNAVTGNSEETSGKDEGTSSGAEDTTEKTAIPKTSEEISTTSMAPLESTTEQADDHKESTEMNLGSSSTGISQSSVSRSNENFVTTVPTTLESEEGTELITEGVTEPNEVSVTNEITEKDSTESSYITTNHEFSETSENTGVPNYGTTVLVTGSNENVEVTTESAESSSKLPVYTTEFEEEITEKPNGLQVTDESKLTQTSKSKTEIDTETNSISSEGEELMATSGTTSASQTEPQNVPTGPEDFGYGGGGNEDIIETRPTDHPSISTVVDESTTVAARSDAATTSESLEPSSPEAIPTEEEELRTTASGATIYSTNAAEIDSSSRSTDHTVQYFTEAETTEAEITTSTEASQSSALTSSSSSTEASSLGTESLTTSSYETESTSATESYSAKIPMGPEDFGYGDGNDATLSSTNEELSTVGSESTSSTSQRNLIETESQFTTLSSKDTTDLPTVSEDGTTISADLETDTGFENKSDNKSTVPEDIDYGGSITAPISGTINTNSISKVPEMQEVGSSRGNKKSIGSNQQGHKMAIVSNTAETNDLPALKQHKKVFSNLPLEKVDDSTKRKWRPYMMDCNIEVDEKGELCREWAKGGLCETHRPTMFLFCRRTCLCTGPPMDLRRF